MKISIKNNKEFKPIELSITIETLQELRELYHRLNTSNDTIYLELDKNEFEWDGIKTDGCYEFWEILDLYVGKNNILL